MKKYILLLATAAMIVFTGCERERIITLDGSVDQKINSLIAGYESDLLGSEHGWMVSVNSKDGYYRFWMDFKVDNKVDMMTDNTRYSKYRTEVQSSSYSFRALQRPTLVFDTYSYLSIINDPDNNISGGSSNKGLVTDFEFEVVKHEPGLFTMKGRFNKVHAIFKKASAEDKAGAKNGYMMDRVNKVHEGLKNYYIFASTSTTDIVMKLYDGRQTYQFYYNARQGNGEYGYGYFNCEVDGTDYLFLPQPFKVHDIETTGLKYNKTQHQFE